MLHKQGLPHFDQFVAYLSYNLKLCADTLNDDQPLINGNVEEDDQSLVPFPK